MSRTTLNARVRLLTTAEGGRAHPLESGYRSLLRLDGTGLDLGFELVLAPDSAGSRLEPGGEGDVQLTIWAADQLPPVSRGQTFEIREGDRVIGRGVIA